MTSIKPILDHIVILVSHNTLLDLPSRLQDTFTIVVGGDHAHGLTSNNLLLFEDGVYIEFIAFVDGIDDGKRQRHPWGQMAENTIVDWAYTLPSGSSFDIIRERMRNQDTPGTPEYSYGDAQPGGRERPDGQVLKWDVVRPQKLGELIIAQLPFWCLDKTPRDLRVPYVDNPQTKHPSGARGVFSIDLTVPQSDVSAIRSAFNAIHDTAGNESSWGITVPSGSSIGTRQLHVRASESKTLLNLTLLGDETSPTSVEIIPGVVICFKK